MRIIVRSDKGVVFTVVFMLVVTLVVSWLFYSVTNSVYIPLAFLGICFFIIIRYWIAVGRIFVFDCDGVTISFLWYKKCYAWEDFQLKQFFLCEEGFGYRSPYSKGIELSYKQRRRPTWLQPMQYCFFVHPFSYIVIHFPPEKQPPIKYPAIYELDDASLIRSIIMR